MILSSYQIDPEFEDAVLAAIIFSPDFLNKYRSVINPSVFTNSVHILIIKETLDYFDEYHLNPSIEILQDILKRSLHRENANAISLLSEIKPISDTQYVRDRLIKWSKWSAIDIILKSFKGDDPKKFVSLMEGAAHYGDEVIDESLIFGNSKSVRIYKDNKFKFITTPWGCLNDRLNGGVSVGDMALVLSVVNGGKTTLLVNVARHAIWAGKFVIYFTFEDGAEKIHRRLIQSFTGATIEQLIRFRDDKRVGNKIKQILKDRGGRCEIKNVITRKTTVDDIASHIRMRQDVVGRKVDLIISDYADRFKPINHRNEPRHEYREIFEACKSIARTEQVVHWTASQANKNRSGKEIVGIEHASEAYGKTESADLVIGIGQTIQDEITGRMIMYTSKVRDAKKHEKFIMLVDFGKQRIREISKI